MMTLVDVYYEEEPRWRTYKPAVKQEVDIERIVTLRPRESSPDYAPDILQRKLRKALPSQPNRKFVAHFEKLDALATDQNLLQGCSEPPSSLVLASARIILHQLETEDLEPTRIVASVEGGVAICFVSEDKYADIECLNSGEILGVISNRRDRPIVWQIDPSTSGFARAAAQIRDFRNAAARSYDVERETR